MLSSLLAAGLFSLLALAIIAWTVKVFFAAIIGDTRGWTEKMRFRGKERVLKSADDLISSGTSAKALDVLRESFYLDTIQIDADLIDRVRGHHNGIVSRLMVLAEKRAGSIPNLAVVDDLLQSRCEMMRLYIETAQSRKQLQRSRRREVPNWAKEEYRRKIDDISDRLKTNRRSIESQLSQLFTYLKRLGEEQADITIH